MVKQIQANNWIALFLTITTLLFSLEATAAVTATVDRYNISVDETINLSVEVTGEDKGEPDTSALQQNFEVLSRNQSSSYSLINGAMSSKSTWFLTLRPRHAGALIIPAFNIGSKKTAPITIQVSKAVVQQPSSTPQGELWIDMSVNPKTVRVQQQAIITLLIYQAVALNQAQLSEPKSDHGMLVRLGEDKNYQVNRSGRTWAVTERRYGIFPQQHGPLQIEPVQLDGIVLAGRSSYSAFQSTRPIRVRSNPAELNVETIPANWKGKAWLPAKQLQLMENWPTGEFRVGDSITRTVTLQAHGLNSSQLPELTTRLPDHLKAYADKPVLNDAKQFDGVVGTRQEKLAILATKPGTFILPAMEIAWWDSETQSRQIANLPPRTFKVLPAPVDATQSSPGIDKNSVAETEQTALQKDPSPQQSAGAWWKWIALLSTLGWFLTLAWIFRKSTASPQSNSSHNNANVDLSSLKKSVLKTCKQNHGKACEQALLNFSKAQWPNEQVNNLAALAKRSEPDLKEQLNMLELHLYAGEGNQTKQGWQAGPLQTAFEQAIFSSGDDQGKPDKQVLPALYPK